MRGPASNGSPNSLARRRLVRDIGSAELAGGDNGVRYDCRAEHVGVPVELEGL